MQFDQLKRREFITLIGGAMTSLAWPFDAPAQESGCVYRLGAMIPSISPDLDGKRQKILIEGGAGPAQDGGARGRQRHPAPAPGSASQRRAPERR